MAELVVSAAKAQLEVLNAVDKEIVMMLNEQILTLARSGRYQFPAYVDLEPYIKGKGLEDKTANIMESLDFFYRHNHYDVSIAKGTHIMIQWCNEK
jgi:hypothetical protein